MMMKDTRCQVFDVSREHIGTITSGRVQFDPSLAVASASFLFLSVSHFLSLSPRPLFPPIHLSLPERLHSGREAAAAGERHSVKVPYQKPAAAARYHARHFAPSCHGRLGPWTMLYLVRIDGRG